MYCVNSNTSTLLSICVPIYGTQMFLQALLESIKEEVTSFNEKLPVFLEERFSYIEQDVINSFLSFVSSYKMLFEVIIVDDGTQEKNAKKLINKVIKEAQKDIKKYCNADLILIEHSRNLGLVEARRSAIFEAKGKWCMFVDSDDELPEFSIMSLLCNAYFSKADIVHGKARLDVSEVREDLYSTEKILMLEKTIQNVHNGILKAEEILNNFLIEKGHVGFLWSKIYLTEIVKEAFEDIPRTYCVMTEDLLIYFFILQHAKSYLGIEDFVYTYYLGRGVTGNTDISSIAQWERASTGGATFTIIFDYLTTQPLNEDLREALEKLCFYHVIQNVKHLKRVVPELKEEARNILIEYWGDNMVKEAEEYIDN
ncbi:MAG: glycosyltransferase family 2 protein [Treponema sp.]